MPTVKHLKVWGSPCYAVLPPHQRLKFGAKSIKGRFVGYELDGVNYSVYYPETNQVKIHRDVDFHEAALFPGMKNQHPAHIIQEGELEHYDHLAPSSFLLLQIKNQFPRRSATTWPL